VVQQYKNADVEKRVANTVNMDDGFTAFVQWVMQVLEAATREDSKLFEKAVASLLLCLREPNSELIRPALDLIVSVAIEKSWIGMKRNSLLELFVIGLCFGCLRLWIRDTRAV
jgi:hypothetical protein